MVSYSWISVIALLGYLFLFIAFASAKKSKVIYSFMLLILALIFFSGGSFFMRIRFWPSVNFWHHVSVFGVMMLPYSFYRFYLDFLEERQKRGRVVCLVFFLILYAANFVTGFLIPTPEVVTDSLGKATFIYRYNWAIYIMIIPTLFILADIILLFFRYGKGDVLMLRQLRPMVIGIVLLSLGNYLSTTHLFSGIPIDIISSAVFAYLTFYALSKKNLFKLTVLVAPTNCYAVSFLISALLFYNLYSPIQSWILDKLHVSEAVSMLMIALMMVISVYLWVLVMRMFLNTLFINDEEVQAETIKEFSHEVSKTLEKDKILSSLIDVIRKLIKVEKAYVFIQNTAGDYILEMTASSLDGTGYVMSADHPVVSCLKIRDVCLLMQDFQRTNSYRCMWDKEKEQFRKLGITCMVPMKDKDELVGMIMLSGKRNGKPYNYDDFSFLMSVSSVCSMAVRNAKMYEQAYDEARKDELTGLYNRKRFYEVLNESFERNPQCQIALIMLNVDDFKLYNQLYGIQEGDIALTKVAQIIQATTADLGMAFRMVGKEFAVLLPSYDAYSAKTLAVSISDQVLSMNEGNIHYRLKSLTLSCGISVSPYLAAGPEELVSEADMAVYSAKRSGKNTVVIYSQNDIANRKKQREHISYYEDYASTIYALTAAIDTKDHYTFNHSQNVAYYASQLAGAYGMNQEFVDIIKEAGLLHDIGKIGISEEILNKPGKLTAEEYRIMKTHVENSTDIIRHLPSMDYVIPAVLSHHERYDGKGYPRGIAGENIPLMGRMLCVADSFDAMVSKRSYKKGMPLEDALQELDAQKGKQFDARIAELFIRLVRQEQVEKRWIKQDET